MATTVLNMRSAGKVDLPVKIDKLVPHVVLELVIEDSTTLNPQFGVMVDTCASLNIMQITLGIHLCKTYPWCYKAVYGAMKYNKIVLTGIVK